jgi:bis(5'-nucleosyl)-tetraphosphatase (symmetrical)
MATYAVGDLQGRHRPFLALLEALYFDPARDRLWLVGDLVNRGDESLECLREVRRLGDAAVATLGNHDLALLALAQRPDAIERANPTLRPVLEAPDREPLLEWLRHRPLLHHDAELGWSMVHAGLAPQWDLQTAKARAAEVEQALRGPDYREFFRHMYGNEPDRWRDHLRGRDRLRVIVNCLTRMRFCRPDGGLDQDYKGPIKGAPAGLTPWFALPDRATRGQRIVFGHWSALDRVAWPEHDVWGVDTGCVWGGKLTALRLDTQQPEITQVDCDC